MQPGLSHLSTKGIKIFTRGSDTMRRLFSPHLMSGFPAGDRDIAVLILSLIQI